MTSYFRPAVDAMTGYVPGEQPKILDLVKLNTNENPFPPSPKVAEALKNINVDHLCRYPDPVSTKVRDVIAELNGYERDWILAGNGSDDILTIAVRSFSSPGLKVASLNPSYSLYPILADIQEAPIRMIDLDDNFELPEDIHAQLKDCNLFMLARPNAPTGNACPLEEVRQICSEFNGIVLVDEAYADFSTDNCMSLVREFDNLIVSRTLSKSYSLANIRFGYAVAQPKLIEGMMKVKDSYNVNGITQALAAAALEDQEHFRSTRDRIKATRSRFVTELKRLAFEVVESQTNFVFAKPPCPADALFQSLREQGLLVRYFGKDPKTADYLRISIGTDGEMDRFVQETERMIKELS
jgi:histidinol-phosphate aminotransferase